MQNKLLTELSNEELLKLIEKEGPSKRAYNSRYLSFISKYNIQPGESKVLSKALYELFKLDNPDISHEKFTKNLGKYIQKTKRQYFLINKSLLDIGKELETILFPIHVAKVRKVRNQRKHIEKFLEHFKLSPGNNSVSLQVLLDIYDLWCYKYKRKKLNDREFRHLLSIYLPEIHIKKLRHFKVADTFFETVKIKRNEEKNKKINR